MQEMSRKNKLFTDSVIRRMTRIAIDVDARSEEHTSELQSQR